MPEQSFRFPKQTKTDCWRRLWLSPDQAYPTLVQMPPWLFYADFRSVVKLF